MAGFNYILSVTGDCSHTGTGVISILPIDGTPPYTIEWVDPPLPPTEILTFTASTRANLNYGFYALRMNDSTEPVNESFYVNVYVSSGSSVNVTGIRDTTCGIDNGAVSATSNSDMSATFYELYTSGGSLLQSSTTDVSPQVFSNLSAGTYYIQATDLGGCVSKSSTFVIEDSSPVDFGFYLVPNSRCSQFNDPIGKIYVTGQTGQPPFSYVWSVDGNDSFLTGLTSDYYSCTVTDALGCSSVKNVFLGEVEPLGFEYFQAVQPTCFAANGALTIYITGGTGPYYYSASTGDVQISYASNFTVYGISAGIYQILVTDAGLCQILAGSILTTEQTIGSVSVTTINSTCSQTDGQIQIVVFQGNPPFNYTLVFPDSSSQNITINSPNYVFQNLSTGDYTVIVSDQGNCVYSQNVSVITSSLYTIAASTTNTSCDQNNGSIYVSITSGGTPPYTYFLDGVAQFVETDLTATTFTSLTSGSHIVSVSDADGCTQSETVSISSSEFLNFDLFSTDCQNGLDGTITVLISSGQPPFKFYWSDNVEGNPQTINLNNLSAGTYSLTIVDVNGCSSEKQTQIVCNSPIFETYDFPVSVEELEVTTEKYSGLLELLNDGFYDLTDGNPDCIFNSATFEAFVDVSPAGISTSQVFYTSTSLTDVPPDNLWTSTLKNLLLSLPGVLNVYIDETNNSITIQKNPASTYLDYQIINVDLKIDYDIDC